MVKSFSDLTHKEQTEFLKDTHFTFDVLSNEIDRRPWSASGDQNDANVPTYLRSEIYYTDDLCPIWTKSMIEKGINILSDKNIDNNTLNPDVYPNATNHLLYAISDYSIAFKDTLTVGSISPWLETLLLYCNANVDIYDYNMPQIEQPINYNLNAINQINNQYDVIVSFSSLEHSGLGRYGDKINPFADIEQMQELKNYLKPNGLLFLAVPLGFHDELIWNHHRIYGPKRFKQLIDGFNILNIYGNFGNKLDDYFYGSNNWQNQPVIVLSKK